MCTRFFRREGQPTRTDEDKEQVTDIVLQVMPDDDNGGAPEIDRMSHSWGLRPTEITLMFKTKAHYSSGTGVTLILKGRRLKRNKSPLLFQKIHPYKQSCITLNTMFVHEII